MLNTYINISCSAAGSAFAFKRAQNGLVVICYFGEGAASEGIFPKSYFLLCSVGIIYIFQIYVGLNLISF